MKRIISITATVIGLCFASAASAQTTPSYLVPDPQTAEWSYIKTDAKGKYLLTEYHSVAKLSGDSYNGNVKIRVKEVTASSPADTVESFIYYRFKDGEYMADTQAFLADDLMGDIEEKAREQVLEIAKEKGTELSEDDKEEVIEKAVKEAMAVMESEFNATGDIRGIPLYPKAGKLPGFEFKFKFSFFNIKVNGENRSIAGTEKIVTDAGTFDCFILEETLTTKIMLVKEVETVRTWYAYGIGVVKEITYDKKGNVTSILTLNSINW